MEYFRIAECSSNEKEIQEKFTVSSIESWCESLFPIEGGSDDEARVGGIWGEFTLHRDQIMGGVRFALLDCPNALAWTITTGYPPAREKIVIHLTINRERKPQEFIEEIEQFLKDLETGLENFLSNQE